MPRASNGNCTLAEDAFVPNTTILSAAMNSDLSDIASMLTDSLSRTGQGGMSAALDMNSHQINELSAGTLNADAVNLGQMQSAISAVTTGIWVIAGGSANAITANYSPAVTSFTDGMILNFRAANANTGAATFSPNSLTAHSIVKYGGTALYQNDILPNQEVIVRYNLANTRWEILDPAISLPNLGAIAGDPVAKTTAYTIVNADKGKTFYFGGSAYYTITVAAASGFDSNFKCLVKNNDSRGKLFSIDGITNFILWPGQSFTLTNIGSSWTTVGLPPRYALTNPQFYIDTTGSNSNDGLGTGSTGAFATIQFGTDFVRTTLDGLGTGTNLQLATGTYTENVHTKSQPLGIHLVFLTGDTAHPENYIITAATASAVLYIDDYSSLILTGVEIGRTGAGAIGVNIGQYAIADFNHITWGSFDSGVGILIAKKGRVNYTGPNIINGNAAVYMYATQGGSAEWGGTTITMPNALVIGTFCQVDGAGSSVQFNPGLTFTGTGSGSGTTGTKYTAAINSVIQLNAVTIPGSIAGTSSTGAQVV